MFNLKKSFNILPLLFWQITFLFFPLIFIFYKHFSYKNFIIISKWLFENNFFIILKHSLSCACIVSFITVFLGFLLSYAINQQNSYVKKICLFLFLIPFISSFLIHMLSLINLFYKSSIINTILSTFSINFQIGKLLYTDFIMYLGYIYCYLPYAFIPLYNALLKFNTALLDASSDLGATFFQSIIKILLPNIKNAILTSFFIVYISASAEFIIPEILGGDKFMHVGSAISYTLLSANLIDYSMIMIILFILSLLLSIFFLYNFLLLIIYYMKQ